MSEITVTYSPGLVSGNGSPEGVVNAALDTIYSDTSVVPAVKYIKTTRSGNTGWQALGGGGGGGASSVGGNLFS